ncbi:MAG TPA: ATP-dependent DNA ligase [Caulobacteraceae bacterium]|jgi:ATP-dependent DNA ligase
MMTDGDFAALAVPLDVAPMEARLAEALPEGAGWQFEPKWDGFRCLAFRDGDAIELKAKSGKSLTRFFPDVVGRLKGIAAQRFVLDGELIIPVGGKVSFEALQMRLHPAESRIRRLSAETPATFVAFDLLSDPKEGNLMGASFADRRARLEALAARFAPGVELTPFTKERAQAQRWLDRLETRLDGVVCKRLDQPYAPGQRAMIKVKRVRTADCVVGGFRYLASRELVGSLLLGLFDEAGRLDHVGYTSTISQADRPELTRRLQALAGGPGFTGDAPGGPSRWSTERSGQWVPVRWELVAEVRFDQVTGGRFRHGATFVRWRPDKAPEQCRRDQIGG